MAASRGRPPVPGPDLVILLDAPPEVLRSRKQGVPLAEVVRQRTAYLKLARLLPSTAVVNAAQPAEDVIHDTVEVIVDHLSGRARKRLHLPIAPDRVSQNKVGPSGSRW